MSKKASPTAIGAFVIGAISLIALGVIVLGSTNLFRTTRDYVIYFEGSVNGLQVGSPIKAQGVEIGEVTAISAVADGVDWTIYTRTLISVDPSRFVDGGLQRETIPSTPQELVEHGLRARLETQSLLTGQLYVSIDFLPDTEVRLVGTRDLGLDVPEIPSLPTRFQEFENSVRAIVRKLETVPLDEVVVNLNETLAGLDRLVNDGQIDSVVANLDGALVETRVAMVDARALMNNVDAKVDPVSEQLVDTLVEAEHALEAVRRATQPGAPLLYQAQSTLNELAKAARALSVLANYLERNPNAVVFGRPRGED